MPLIAPSSYRPPAYLRNAHLQTILPATIRRVTVPYVRERITTPDDDFLNLDWVRKGEEVNSGLSFSSSVSLPPLIILSHGLEGDSRRPYLAGMVKHLTANGFDCLAWNYRSCGGDMNQQARFYHIGETGDLNLVINHALHKGYQALHLLGFSAGGSVTLKYLGEQGEALHPAIRRAVTFSVPLSIMSSVQRLEAWDSMVYNRRFSRSLTRKVMAKAALMPGKLSVDGLQRVRTVREFDSLFTAPMHGFRDVDDYYQQSRALPFLARITIPTLIVNAKNDPFLSPDCFPEQLARELPNVFMEFPEAGGHCGFPPGGAFSDEIRHGIYWSEERAVAFLTDKL
ncbi:MAG: alpha/beta fold hydrolase [Bacteroidetes bacterium]|nr:alpha/beta fold hydrolase [Fibrella sp.]